MPEQAPSTVSGRGAEGLFARHLRAALRALAAETPTHARAMRARIGRRTVTFEVGSERVTVDLTRGDPVRGGAPVGDVLVRCHAALVSELARARRTVVDAIFAEDLVLVGGVDDLVAFDEALRWFLHGAVRAPSFPARLEAFEHELAGHRTGDPRTAG